ncbi:MAG: hypothetical protein GXP62_17550 [Oligoflexia bacterium]|nr:hypothetical protein [Oligoflexia bacterium]
MRPTRLLVIVASLASLSSVALAQDAPQPRVIYKERTEIDFEGVEVAGELVKPQGALLLDRKRASFNPLIKLRLDFNTEMSQSVDEVK